MIGDISQFYSRLLPFYQLIYQSDIEPYRPVDLNSLATRLEAQLALEKKQIIINNELSEKSKANVAQVLKKKMNKQKKQSQEKVERKPMILLQQSQSKIQQSFIDECAVFKKPEEFKITEEVQGTIYEGKLMISLTIARINKAKETKSAIFQVCPQRTQTTLSKQAALSIGIKEFSDILIQGREIRVLFTDSKQSKIGLNFLRNHNILLNLNYRPEKSNFTLRFSS